MEFLSKDPTQQLDELKERLYNRLERSRQFIEHYGVDERREFDSRAAGFDRAVRDEILFLEHILDDMERV